MNNTDKNDIWSFTNYFSLTILTLSFQILSQNLSTQNVGQPSIKRLKTSLPQKRNPRRRVRPLKFHGLYGNHKKLSRKHRSR